MTKQIIAEPQEQFPFVSKICLKPLLRAWHAGQCGHPLFGNFCTEIDALQAAQPELFEPSEDAAHLRKESDLVQLIVAPVVSCSESEHNLAAVMRPYFFDFIFTTPAFREQLMNEHGEVTARSKLGSDEMANGRQMSAYMEVAKRIYGLDFSFEPKPILINTDPETGLNRYYQLRFDRQYLDVVATRKPKKLHAKQIERLQQNPLDLALWRELFPSDAFELHGVIAVTGTEVTSSEVVSELQQAITGGTQLVSSQGIELLTRSVRDLLRQPRLKARLLALKQNKVFMIQAACDGYSGCLISNSRQLSGDDLAGSIYKELANDGGRIRTVANIDTLNDSPVHQILRSEGVRSLALLPLMEDGEKIGVLQLDSPLEDQSFAGLELALYDVRSLAVIGLRQSRQALEQGISAVIQKKSSIVHPSVEWRFREAAFNIITGGGKELEEIVFREVYPLYSQSDIKDSSAFRNRAIQADLSAQLRLAKTVLDSATYARNMPLLDEMGYRIEVFLNGLEDSLRSGDELSMSNFFRQEFEPVLEQLEQLGGPVAAAVSAYREQINPRYGALYDKRSEYEQSVLLINERVSRFLDQQQLEAQQMFPHYCEKTATDGVEMMMYLGASLVEDGRFDPFFLRNLRLWQLRVTCEVARLCQRLKAEELSLPLEAAHLVLVQDAPLSIRFSETERDFIVDGAYNIRYEIMKKRIDKALVNGGSERLTLPGKIAIVYSHVNEAREYRRYIDYLQHQGFLEPEIEDLELQAMQGVQGLRALRVTVKAAASVSDDDQKQAIQAPQTAAEPPALETA